MHARRVWLITGVSAGLGRALAEAALARGDVVVAGVRRPDSVADLVAAHPDRCVALRLDVSDTERGRAVVAEVVERFGRLDVLVNNAGRVVIGAAEDIDEAASRALMELHFFGPVAMTRAALPHMRERGSGTIVQLSSQLGRYAQPTTSAYSATKFALEGWSEALAAEAAPLGVRVLLVEPGPFRTEINAPNTRETHNPSPCYQQLFEGACATADGLHGHQRGDPRRAADVVIDVLDVEDPPLRLPLGVEAIDTIAASLDGAKREIAAWESRCRGADFDE